MITTTVTRYNVTAVPPEHEDINDYFDITVEAVKQVDQTLKWAVRWRGMCLHSSGRWDWEPSPSGRSDRWLAGHRFSFLRKAMKLAEKAAPLLTVNGWRPDHLPPAVWPPRS